MAMNSVNTNMGALVALQSLNRTNDALDATQKRISTGFRVADAKDDGAAYAVAQKVRSDVAAVTSANEQLSGAKGLLDVSLAGLGQISKALEGIKTAMIKLSDDKIVGTERDNYEAQYDSLAKQIGQFVNDSSYNGATLLGVSSNADGVSAAAAGASFDLVRNEVGETYAISGQSAGTFDLLLAASVATGADDASQAEQWAAHMAATAAGGFAAVEQAVNGALNAYGNNSKAVENLISFNKDKIDALESGLGGLVDADLAKESAKLQSLQIRQQLGTQALSMANQAPQSLLSLFR
jgi:flagellin